MKRRKILPKKRDELESLPTKRLLARLKQLHQCEESLVLSDKEISNYGPSKYIEFKDSSEWITQHNILKEILSSREHIPSKK
jgi:hypothetical protein